MGFAFETKMPKYMWISSLLGGRTHFFLDYSSFWEKCGNYSKGIEKGYLKLGDK